MELHDGSDLQLTDAMAEAASWHIAAQLCRRYPEDMAVIESHPGGLGAQVHVARSVTTAGTRITGRRRPRPSLSTGITVPC